MKMTNKNISRFLPVILIFAIVAILAVVLAPRLVSQSKVVQSFQNSAKDKQIAELLATMSKNPNKESQEYKELRQKFCLLTARPVKDREKPVANIKEFLHGIYPTSSKDFSVEFLCSRFAGKSDDSGSDYNNPAMEQYEAANFSFDIDPKTNYIIGVGEAERTQRTDPSPEYDYTPRYSKPEELRQIAEKFLTDHQGIFGVDISKMTYTFEGTKPGNFFMNWKDTKHPYTKEVEVCGNLGEGSVDATYEGAYQRADGTWCVKRQSSHDPQVDITITTGGQIIVYRNNILDLPKL
jgi:type II secretory pathway pseudopilin PulG